MSPILTGFPQKVTSLQKTALERLPWARARPFSLSSTPHPSLQFSVWKELSPTPSSCFPRFLWQLTIRVCQREVLVWVWRVGLAWVKWGKWSPSLFALLAPTGEPRGPHPVGWPGPALCYCTSSLCPSGWGAVATAEASFQSPICALPSSCSHFQH